MKNKYFIRGDTTAIVIFSQKHGRLEALISTKKLEKADEFPGKWYVVWNEASNTFYVHGCVPFVNGKQRNGALHRWITNAPESMHVDHFDHDGLNNKDDNLRICTNAENQQNRVGAQKNSTTGIRGVIWDKRRSKWRAQIKINGKSKHVGSFTSILEAERAVKEARSKYMPYSQEA